jgi:hypothetical protein
MGRFSKSHLLDIVERSAMTFVQAFFAVVLATPFAFQDVEVLKAAAIAALLAALKGAIASFTGAPDSASFLPAPVDPPVDSDPL